MPMGSSHSRELRKRLESRLWEMIDHARAKKVTAQYDLEDLLHDVETIRERRNRP